MAKVNLEDVKENGVFKGILKGYGSVYELNGRLFMIGKDGFQEIILSEVE